MIKIYHNPRCGKSRNALNSCISKNQEVEIIEYLKNPPSIADLERIAKKLTHPFEDIIRKKEELFIEKFNKKDFKQEEWIKILHQNPILIERPIIETPTTAFVARTQESLLWIQQL